MPVFKIWAFMFREIVQTHICHANGANLRSVQLCFVNFAINCKNSLVSEVNKANELA